MKKIKLLFNHYYLRHLVLWMIRLYQKIFSPDHGIFSSVLPYGCKFRPTCSQYTYQAIEKYGIIKGGLLGTKRLFRCHPFSRGGYDPVP